VKSYKTPLCIHRAPLGTHERFIGFLIEHYAGNFPLWLAPDQVRVITLNDDEALINYAQPIVAELRANMVRVDSDFSLCPQVAGFLRSEPQDKFIWKPFAVPLDGLVSMPWSGRHKVQPGPRQV